MVELSSWQAQLSGTKIWTLAPPPECEHVCQSFNITVNKGDISKCIHNLIVNHDVLWKLFLIVETY